MQEIVMECGPLSCWGQFRLEFGFVWRLQLLIACVPQRPSAVRLGEVLGADVLALLWQIYSRCFSLQIHFLQRGHRCGGGRAMSSRMAWRTAGNVGRGGGPLILFFPPCCFKPAILEESVGDHRHERMTVKALPGSALEVIETKFFFQLLVSLLANPSCLDGGR